MKSIFQDILEDVRDEKDIKTNEENTDIGFSLETIAIDEAKEKDIINKASTYKNVIEEIKTLEKLETVDKSFALESLLTILPESIVKQDEARYNASSTVANRVRLLSHYKNKEQELETSLSESYNELEASLKVMRRTYEKYLLNTESCLDMIQDIIVREHVPVMIKTVSGLKDIFEINIEELTWMTEYDFRLPGDNKCINKSLKDLLGIWCQLKTDQKNSIKTLKSVIYHSRKYLTEMKKIESFIKMKSFPSDKKEIYLLVLDRKYYYELFNSLVNFSALINIENNKKSLIDIVKEISDINV